ncbi:hypothetical protein SLEP1_g18326 [Rubroshorea leprosula]|uniref:Uncharacterized protein n=1 Tax=Rubroshorea leprosula TaxID=152421 RepID=A0AAV5IX24_9ROSI|nr:hypothetical protein SLEP1_g18326 [Rubroshorea leprosula]
MPPCPPTRRNILKISIHMMEKSMKFYGTRRKLSFLGQPSN